MDRHAGSLALVTGASAGIGACIAQRLVSKNIEVIGLARRLDKLNQVKLACGPKASLFHPYECDLTDFPGLKRMFDWILQRFGGHRLEILINNAGMMMYGSLLEQTPQDWTAMMDVNLVGPSYITQLTTKIMLSHGNTEGNIVFINSMAGHVVNDNPMTSFYNAGKFALTTLIDQWRQEVNN